MSCSRKDEDFLIKRYSKPSLRQVKAVVDFIQKHPVLSESKRNKFLNMEKVNKLWVEMTNKVNSMGSVSKSTKSWIKYWMDKRRHVILKHRNLQNGKTNLKLSHLETKILNICLGATKKGRQMKRELSNNNYCNEDNEDKNEELQYENNDSSKCNGLKTSMCESPDETYYMKMMESVADVMEKQAAAFTQMAQSWYNHSNAMGRLADASYQQAVAVGRLANSFETIDVSLLDMKNAVASIDGVLKRSLTATLPDQHNTHLFA